MNAVTKECSSKMDKTIKHFEGELAAIRAGRANPAVLDKVQVDYYGVPTAINAMAAVSVSESRILVIQPWDKTSIKAISKAILASDIGINPTDDGEKIRLEFPKLTEERRKELSKDIKKIGEDTKVNIRNIRRDYIDKLKTMKKNSEITEDDQKTIEKEIQKETDNACTEIDKLVKNKEAEVMSI